MHEIGGNLYQRYPYGGGDREGGRLNPKIMEWINVNYQMPEPFTCVIVAGGVGLWTGVKWNTITGYQWPGQTIAWEVTHWMPLPQPPTE